ncbi:uncharacterized protein BO72DRAFT_477841 [Aspergillus fijiensis CBS 313.89]|uniref:Zn(2)-C6 fungal-type domain-containing protein n=1 Tax=Aspergillus fijiensis CBS 313.89 TaxID=1448319 RepID=A0A8G1RP57_9EURO|nr:uncharacterized protein BO72DRAFT_477841 [Aspergillus fijiensis CBS 313.89]RAK76910.1 hypothetical protein BO72DRAFT_477841 [Aspergillus fijiensis CBS 313.89]
MTTSGRVCARCAVIKQRCDGTSPCSRCARLGHICEPQQPGRPNAEAQTLANRRPRASRSRDGCVSCKARKKKCDEKRPRCSDCRRLNLPCYWNAPRARSPPPVIVSPLPSPPEMPLSEAAHDLILSSVSDPTPELDPISPSDHLLSSVGDDPILPFSPSWIDVEMILGPVSPPPDSGLNAHLHNDDDRCLFNHYVQIVARALSRSTTNSTANPFLATLLPMAANSETLTSALLGLSGCHWRRVYPQIWNRALTRQGRALSQVNNLLSRRPNRQSFLEACTSILLLCLTELFEGTSRAWKWHLKAAGRLLGAIDRHRLASTSEGTFCLQLFHYLDAMSTISRCKPPLLRAGERLTDLTLGSSLPSYLPAAASTSSPSGDTISGLPTSLLESLGRVNLLAAHRSRRIDDLSEIGFRTAAAHVRAGLDTWRRESEAVRPDNEVDHLATQAFEWAIRLRLHQIVDGYDPHHAEVEQAVAGIVAAGRSIPYGSPVEGSLLFPLVIAGASSRSMERRMGIKERLMVMENTLGWGHILQARQLLEAVWADDRADANWASVRYSLFPGMVFV